MKVRVLSILTAGAMVLGVAGLMAPAASASRSPQASHVTKVAPHAVPHSVNAVCSQLDNDNGVGIVSQNFETSLDAYDNAGADDCIVGAKHKGKHVLTAIGVYFNGPGPAVSETVNIYKDAGGLPGTTFVSKTKTGGDSAGTFTIKLGKFKILPGAYWVSVVANMDFSGGGEWGWSTNNTVRGLSSVWENPGNGFATGCTSWNTTTTCIPSGEGGDFAYELS